MTGIVFFRTRQYDEVLTFYTDRLDCSVWLEQPDCTILQYDNQLVGFCDRKSADTEGIITFVEPDRERVDEVYDRLKPHARGPPVENEAYDIYQFFANDPEGRTVEVQAFLHETPPV